MYFKIYIFREKHSYEPQRIGSCRVLRFPTSGRGTAHKRRIMYMKVSGTKMRIKSSSWIFRWKRKLQISVNSHLQKLWKYLIRPLKTFLCYSNSWKFCRSSKLFKDFTENDKILLIFLLTKFNYVYTMVVRLMSLDVILPFDIDKKTISMIFTVSKTIRLVQK